MQGSTTYNSMTLNPIRRRIPVGKALRKLFRQRGPRRPQDMLQRGRSVDLPNVSSHVEFDRDGTPYIYTSNAEPIRHAPPLFDERAFSQQQHGETRVPLDGTSRQREERRSSAVRNGFSWPSFSMSPRNGRIGVPWRKLPTFFLSSRERDKSELQNDLETRVPVLSLEAAHINASIHTANVQTADAGADVDPAGENLTADDAHLSWEFVDKRIYGHSAHRRNGLADIMQHPVDAVQEANTSTRMDAEKRISRDALAHQSAVRKAALQRRPVWFVSSQTQFELPAQRTNDVSIAPDHAMKPVFLQRPSYHSPNKQSSRKEDTHCCSREDDDAEEWEQVRREAAEKVDAWVGRTSNLHMERKRRSGPAEDVEGRQIGEIQSPEEAMPNDKTHAGHYSQVGLRQIVDSAPLQLQFSERFSTDSSSELPMGSALRGQHDVPARRRLGFAERMFKQPSVGGRKSSDHELMRKANVKQRSERHDEALLPNIATHQGRMQTSEVGSVIHSSQCASVAGQRVLPSLSKKRTSPPSSQESQKPSPAAALPSSDVRGDLMLQRSVSLNSAIPSSLQNRSHIDSRRRPKTAVTPICAPPISLSRSHVELLDRIETWRDGVAATPLHTMYAASATATLPSTAEMNAFLACERRKDRNSPLMGISQCVEGSQMSVRERVCQIEQTNVKLPPPPPPPAQISFSGTPDDLVKLFKGSVSLAHAVGETRRQQGCLEHESDLIDLLSHEHHTPPTTFGTRHIRQMSDFDAQRLFGLLCERLEESKRKKESGSNRGTPSRDTTRNAFDVEGQEGQETRVEAVRSLDSTELSDHVGKSIRQKDSSFRREKETDEGSSCADRRIERARQHDEQQHSTHVTILAAKSRESGAKVDVADDLWQADVYDRMAIHQRLSTLERAIFVPA